MNATGATIVRDIRGVDDQITNLARKNIRVDPSEFTSGAVVPVALNHAEGIVRIEGSCSLDDGHVGGVTNQLGIEEVQDRVGDQVGTVRRSELGLICSGDRNTNQQEGCLPSREIDSSRSESGTFTGSVKAAPVAAADGSVDGKSIVSDTIALGTKVLHVAKDLIGSVRVEGSATLMGDILHPVGANHLEKKSTHEECRV